MTFVFKNAHNINVQIIQIDEWHLCLFHTNLWKEDFTWQLLLNCGPWSLWWNAIHDDS
jgi:hypothetical protein